MSDISRRDSRRAFKHKSFRQRQRRKSASRVYARHFAALRIKKESGFERDGCRRARKHNRNRTEQHRDRSMNKEGAVAARCREFGEGLRFAISLTTAMLAAAHLDRFLARHEGPRF